MLRLLIVEVESDILLYCIRVLFEFAMNVPDLDL